MMTTLSFGRSLPGIYSRIHIPIRAFISCDYICQQSARISISVKGNGIVTPNPFVSLSISNIQSAGVTGNEMVTPKPLIPQVFEHIAIWAMDNYAITLMVNMDENMVTPVV